MVDYRVYRNLRTILRIRVTKKLHVNPYPADLDYCRFYSVLLVEQITVIGNEMCV